MASISRRAMDEVRRHAADEYPNECCGVIVTGPGPTLHVLRIRNVQDELHAKDPHTYPRTARTAYVGHPADLRWALDMAEQPGAHLAAFYHSHPDHDAYFSAEDMAQATPFGDPSYPDALQVVVSVYGGRVKVIKAFAWSPEDEAYLETTLDEDENP